MRNNHDNASRRDFIKKITLLSASGAAAPVLLSACGGGGSEADSAAPMDAPMDAPEESMAMQEAPMEEAPMEEGFSCMDTSGLTEMEITQREAVNYVDMTPDPEKTCANCQLYTAPEAGMQCGGCTVVKGPIHPKGYCDLWVIMPA